MHKAINNQINAELWSAYLYLAMAMDAEAKALRGIANWFFVQWLEEQDHARIFQNYMNSNRLQRCRRSGETLLICSRTLWTTKRRLHG